MKTVRTFSRVFLAGIGAVLVTACASGILKYEKAGELKKIEEFEEKVQIEAPPDPEEAKESAEAGDPVASATPAPAPTPAPTPTPVPKNAKAAKKSKKAEPAAPAVPGKHEPELEGQKGFLGRRPVTDPFRVGEKVIHEVSYFNVKAGEMVLQVKPFAQVNGRKNYHFQISIKNGSLFSSFYEVDDRVNSMMDFENMVPSVYTLHVKETNQLKEARFFIDWSKNQASYWENKVTKKSGREEKKLQWEVPPYSQDVFSSIFYLRVFQWAPGVENAFRVADDEQNLIFRGKALRREKITVGAGTFQAIVIKPDVELKGQFKPVGDIFIWLSDDDRKYILKIESKIKIGTIVSEATRIVPGSPP